MKVCHFRLTVIIISATFLHIKKSNIGFIAMAKSRKIPIQIYLDPDHYKMIDHLSKSRKTSKAATIRNCIANYLESLPLEDDPALNIMNLGASGIKDIAAKHDDYLVESKKRNSE